MQSAASYRRLMMGQPFFSAWALRVASGSTATGWVTFVEQRQVIQRIAIKPAFQKRQPGQIVLIQPAFQPRYLAFPEAGQT